MESIPPADPIGADAVAVGRRGRPQKLTAVLAVVCVAIAALAWRKALLTSQRETSVPRARPFRTLHWQTADAASKAAMIRSISAQLEAFKRDDYKQAIFYQSNSLRHHFSSAAAFRVMMKSNYPQFAHYKTAKFGPAQTAEHGLHAQIPILLTGQDGVQVSAIYIMILEDKIYRVEGVAGGVGHGPAAAPGIAT